MPLVDAGIGPVADLLSKVFGWTVDPNGLATMKLEHRLEIIHAGVEIAISKEDDVATDVLFDQYRLLSKSLG